MRLRQVLRLARTHDVDVVAAGAQAALQALYGQGDAVDLRRIGLGDDGVAHGSSRLPQHGEKGWQRYDRRASLA